MSFRDWLRRRARRARRGAAQEPTEKPEQTSKPAPVSAPDPTSNGREEWYLLQKVDGPHPRSLDPQLAGVSVRVSWRALEPRRDGYDFSYLDELLSWAGNHDARVTLRVMAGTLAPAHSYKTQTAGIPTPWEGYHQQRFRALMTALANRYWRATNLGLVHVPGFWESAEFHVPAQIRNDSYMAESFIERLRAVAQAFAGPRIALNHSPEPFSQKVINYARTNYPTRIAFQMNALKADTNTSWPGYTVIRDLGLAGEHIGWQFVGPSTNEDRFGGTFEQAVELGRAGNPKYWEVYGPDVGKIR